MKDKVYKVKGMERYVGHIAEYQNGIETTGGFYKKDDLEQADSVSITYDSEHATELPIEWPHMDFLSDNNMRQKINGIFYEKEPAYLMQDSSLSYEVTT